jgi:hypothetical protein
MDPSLSMNTMQGSVDRKEMERRGKLYAAQRASQPLTFHPKDGSAPLRAWALNEAGDGWWDIIVDNTSVEDGTPHRIFETRSRMVGPLDTDVRGLFSVGAPPVDRESAFASTLHLMSNEQAIRNQAAFADYAHHRIGQNAKIGEAMGAMGNVAYDSADALGAATTEMDRVLPRHRSQAVGGGIAQQLRAPGKMFSRSDILAILRGRLATLKAGAPDVPESARFEIEYVIRIFENLE